MLAGLLIFTLPAKAAENLIMRGTLVAAPCFIRPGDDLIKLDFEEVIDKFLYRYKRTPSRPLRIHLEDCDISVFKGVKVTFQGIENRKVENSLKKKKIGTRFQKKTLDNFFTMLMRCRE